MVCCVCCTICASCILLDLAMYATHPVIFIQVTTWQVTSHFLEGLTHLFTSLFVSHITQCTIIIITFEESFANFSFRQLVSIMYCCLRSSNILRNLMFPGWWLVPLLCPNNTWFGCCCKTITTGWFLFKYGSLLDISATLLDEEEDLDLLLDLGLDMIC